MGFLLWIVIGLLAGAIVESLAPGGSPGGIKSSVLLGIAGAIIGGMIGVHFGVGTLGGFHVRNLMIGICGAMLALVVYRFISSMMSA